MVHPFVPLLIKCNLVMHKIYAKPKYMLSKT